MSLNMFPFTSCQHVLQGSTHTTNPKVLPVPSIIVNPWHPSTNRLATKGVRYVKELSESLCHYIMACPCAHPNAIDLCERSKKGEVGRRFRIASHVQWSLAPAQHLLPGRPASASFLWTAPVSWQDLKRSRRLREIAGSCPHLLPGFLVGMVVGICILGWQLAAACYWLLHLDFRGNNSTKIRVHASRTDTGKVKPASLMGSMEGSRA